MAMAISISIGLREQSILAGIFMLHWCTMAFGFLVEYIAVPKYMLDTTAHWRPVGAYEMELWERNERPPTAVERYRNDPRALKLISQDQWNMDRPLYDVQKTDTLLATESDLYVRQQREQNYLRRMVPHVFGWFPCTAAWVIIIVHLEWAKHDLSLVSDRQIPEWVNGAIYGTVLIFWSFTVVSCGNPDAIYYSPLFRNIHSIAHGRSRSSSSTCRRASTGAPSCSTACSA